ncbi:MAG TPA: hypothetical protein VJY62_08080 [Bacteroidia bacterium]|nr:hypothetical protein [Bacteroidia bacterium]
MTTLISASKNDFLLGEHPVNLHVETTEWLSDIEFCKTELAFLCKLLNKVLFSTGNIRKINELDMIDKKIKVFKEKTLKEIHDSVISHEQHLASLDENAFAQEANVIKQEHYKTSMSVKAFMSSVKKVKKEIFDFVEGQMKQSKKIAKDFEEGNLTL